MPSVTHDGRSFLLESRRIWLVSGQVAYARIPRESWAERIHAAKQAGLNTIETSVFWNRHEPRPGRFDFSGDNDIRHFISLVGRAGMHCILGLGPYVGAQWDMGGLPAWLLESPTVAFRTQNAAFLEASSRFITAVAEQVKSLQATASGAGGPIVLVECESEWDCGHEVLAASYIGELIRYIREAGLSVPIINSNNLWQGVEGQIDGWTGSQELLATTRQLASVRTSQPRVIIEFNAASPVVWGKAPEAQPTPMMLQRRLAEVLAGGGQYNLRPFAGGTNFGFSGGRGDSALGDFYAAEFGRGAPLGENGERGESYAAIRRINHFASRFGRVFANLDPSFHPVMIDPTPVAPENKSAKGAGAWELAVAHAKGSQGSVVFVFGEEGSARSGNRQTRLLLGNGTTLPVALGQQAVAWCLVDVHVSAKAHMDYCNLNAFAAVGQVFVCYGPGGTRGMLSVNGSPLEVIVPASGKMPLTVDHEGLTIVVANEEQIDSIFIGDDAALIGVSGVTPEGFPILPAGVKTYTRAGSDGVVKQVLVESRGHSAAHAAGVVVSAWMVSGGSEYQAGTSARYASVAGPAEMALLGCPHGYGWYRLTLGAEPARKAKLLFPNASDRIHAFLDGEHIGIAGHGPGAEELISASFKKGTQQLVLLAENMGRFSGGSNLGERKGLYGECYEVAPLKVAPAKIVRGEPLDVLAYRAPLWGVSEGDTTSPDRVTWTINHRRKTPVIMSIPTCPAPGILLVGGKPVGMLDPTGPRFLTLTSDQLNKGAVQFQLSPLSHGVAEAALKELNASVKFYEGLSGLCAKSEMAFAKWEPPAATTFGPAKTDKTEGPKWWKASFTPGDSDGSLYFEATGLAKGQLYVNGRHLCRYFVAVGNQRVEPQQRYYIPRSMVRPKQPNEIMLFDEEGASPAKARLVYG
ncbi:MAG: beta-galactosidase [Phycisphaerales bacterium]